MDNKIKHHNPEVLPPKKIPTFDRWAVPLGAAISGGLVALALPNLIDVSGASGIAKAVLIAGGATLATYSVNRFAIDKGTELASRGFITASVASVLSMTFVGTAFFASTFAGLTLPDVEKLRLQEHGNAYIQYIGERNLQASKAGRTLPVMRSINRDLPAKASCEIREACISGRGKGGRGTIAKILEGLAGRSAAISEQLETGEATRQSTLKQLNKLVGEYQSVLGQSDKSIWERRGELQKIDAKVNQIIATLDEAIPLALLRAYASELNDGVSISERPVASRRLNALLKKHGNPDFGGPASQMMQAQERAKAEFENRRLRRIAGKTTSRCECASAIVSEKRAWAIYSGSSRLITPPSVSNNLNSSLVRALHSPQCVMKG